MNLRSGRRYNALDTSFFGPRPLPKGRKPKRYYEVIDPDKQSLAEKAAQAHEEGKEAIPSIENAGTKFIRSVGDALEYVPFGGYFTYVTNRASAITDDVIANPSVAALTTATVPLGAVAGGYIGGQIGKKVYQYLDPTMGALDYAASFVPGSGSAPIRDAVGGFAGRIVGTLAGSDIAYRATLQNSDRLKATAKRMGNAAYARLISSSQQPAKYVLPVPPKAPQSSLYKQVAKDRPDQFKAPTMLNRHQQKQAAALAMQQMTQSLGYHTAARAEHFKSAAAKNIEEQLGVAPNVPNSTASTINGRVKAIYQKVAQNPLAQSATVTAMAKLAAQILTTSQKVETDASALETAKVSSGYFSSVANYLSALVKGQVTAEVVIPERSAFQRTFDYLTMKAAKLPAEQINVVTGTNEHATSLPYKFVMDTLKVLGYGSADDVLPKPPPAKLVEVIQPTSLLQSVGNSLAGAFTIVSNTIQANPYISTGIALGGLGALAATYYQRRQKKVVANGARTSRNVLEDRAMSNGNDFQGTQSKRMANYSKLQALDESRRQSALVDNARLAGASNNMPASGPKTRAGRHMNQAFRMEQLKQIQQRTMGMVQLQQVVSDTARAVVDNTNDDIGKVLDNLESFILDESFQGGIGREADLAELLEMDLSVIEHLDKEAETVLDVARTGQYMAQLNRQVVPTAAAKMHFQNAYRELDILQAFRNQHAGILIREPVVYPPQPLAQDLQQQYLPATVQESTTGGENSLLKQGMLPSTVNKPQPYAYSYYDVNATQGPQIADAYMISRDFNDAVYQDTLLARQQPAENMVHSILKSAVQNKLIQRLIPAQYAKARVAVPHEVQALNQMYQGFAPSLTMRQIYETGADTNLVNKLFEKIERDPATQKIKQQLAQVYGSEFANQTYQSIKEATARNIYRKQQQGFRGMDLTKLREQEALDKKGGFRVKAAIREMFEPNARVTSYEDQIRTGNIAYAKGVIERAKNVAIDYSPLDTSVTDEDYNATMNEGGSDKLIGGPSTATPLQYQTDERDFGHASNENNTTANPLIEEVE